MAQLGILDHLKKREKIEKTQSHVQAAIVGLSWEAIELFDFLSRQFTREQVAIIDHREWSENHLFYPGPCVDRGEISGQLLQDFVPGISLQQGEESLFYKDQRFRPFGGRAQPHQLQDGENYFKWRPNFFDPIIFLDGNIAGKMAQARQAYHNIEVRGIDLNHPFTLSLAGHQDLKCEKLYYGRSPREFLSLVQDHQQLTEQFIRYSSQFEQNFSLVAVFDFDSPLLQSSQTLFIPQSQTYDQGHFIVEVDHSAPQLKAYCQMSEVTEEEVTKKLKLLKRTLRRLFPHFSKHLREKIYLLDYFPFCPISDDIGESIPHFSYFGWNAPLDQVFLRDNQITVDSGSIFNNARSVLSIKQIQNTFDHY